MRHCSDLSPEMLFLYAWLVLHASIVVITWTYYTLSLISPDSPHLKVMARLALGALVFGPLLVLWHSWRKAKQHDSEI